MMEEKITARFVASASAAGGCAMALKWGSVSFRASSCSVKKSTRSPFSACTSATMSSSRALYNARRKSLSEIRMCLYVRKSFTLVIPSFANTGSSSSSTVSVGSVMIAWNP